MSAKQDCSQPDVNAVKHNAAEGVRNTDPGPPAPNGGSVLPRWA